MPSMTPTSADTTGTSRPHSFLALLDLWLLLLLPLLLLPLLLLLPPLPLLFRLVRCLIFSLDIVLIVDTCSQVLH